jgi:hypothetical protein
MRFEVRDHKEVGAPITIMKQSKVVQKGRKERKIEPHDPYDTSLIGLTWQKPTN